MLERTSMCQRWRSCLILYGSELSHNVAQHCRQELGSRTVRRVYHVARQARAQPPYWDDHRIGTSAVTSRSRSAGRLGRPRALATQREKPSLEEDKSNTTTPEPKTTPTSPTQALRQQIKSKLQNLSPQHENIYTIPNILTFTRLLAAPAVGYLVLHDQHLWAAGLFAYAGITDLVDGWVARRWKLQSVVGSVIDPMADKALMTILVGCLAIKGALPLWLAIVIFGRDMSLGFAAIYYRYASLPPPKTFTRYWDFSIPSAEVHPTQVSKYNTFLQLVLIGATTTLPLVTDGMLPGALGAADVERAVVGMQYLVAATTLWSGASYVWRKDVVKILGDDEALKKKQGFRGRAIIGISFAGFAALALWAAQRPEKEGKPVAIEVNNTTV